MSNDAYIVYAGHKLRSPVQAARVVGENGHAFHVIDADRADEDQRMQPRLPFADAVAEACRRAGRPVPVGDE